ncbi:TPA: hypothetical protein DEG75_04060 [Candidatus Dependentiae bacterium]|nr:hypothetical protein [Candidatus Dependentiae bacterium]
MSDTRISIPEIIKRSKRLVNNQWIDIRTTPAVGRKGRLIAVAPRRAGNAIVRNLFKRRARALFREKNLAETGFDWILFAKRDVHLCTFAAMQNLVCAGFLQLSPSSSQPSSLS